MTLDQRAKLEQVARELRRELTQQDTDWDCCLSNEQASVAIIVKTLTAQRATVLEEAFAGLKVSNEKLQWALKELGPTGNNAEAYVQAAVEHVIFLRQQAQERRA